MNRIPIFILSLILISIINQHISFAQDTSQWHVPDGAMARLGKGGINGITYSPDSVQLIIASSIGVWGYNMDTGEELPLLTGYTGFVSSIVYSPNGRTLPVSCIHQTVVHSHAEMTTARCVCGMPIRDNWLLYLLDTPIR